MQIRNFVATLSLLFAGSAVATGYTGSYSAPQPKSSGLDGIEGVGWRTLCGVQSGPFGTASLVVFGSFDDDAAWPSLKAWCMANPDTDSRTYLNAFVQLRAELKAHPERRAGVLALAYQEAMGRPPLPGDEQYWQGRMQNEDKWWFATIQGELIRYINKVDKNERRATIDRAYLEVLGRPASEGDAGYWLPRPEHFRPLVDANRAWLYSPSGSQELPEVVKRARAVKGGRDTPPVLTATQLQTRVAMFTAKKSTFKEMVYYFNH